jgi:hypothetical protein
MQQRHQRLTVLRYERIEIDKRFDAVGHPVGQSRYHHAAIKMADENNVADFLGLEQPATSRMWVSRVTFSSSL